MASTPTVAQIAAARCLGEAILRFVIELRPPEPASVPPKEPPRPVAVPPATPSAQPATLLLSAREAARLIGVSERTLWQLSAPRGKLPAVRLGRVVRYDPDDLKAWIGSSKQQGE